MRHYSPRNIAAAITAFLVIVSAGMIMASAVAQQTQQPTAGAPFGDEQSVGYAGRLWQQLAGASLVGENSPMTMPYKGTSPHGGMLDYLESAASVDGHSGLAIVKRNYGGEDLTREKVLKNPDQFLQSVTVMFRREAGYDPENKNWFWAKYNPDGSLQTNPAGKMLAGRVAKGADSGCIACHKVAPGGDYVYSYDLEN